MIQVSIFRGRFRYPIVVAPGLLGDAGRAIGPFARGRRILLVTDRTVARLYARRVLASLSARGYDAKVVVLPAGERAKSIASVRRIGEQWSRWAVDRSSVVLSLGGGVVSDVAGFAASAYARGLGWIAFPTTLLAQADAAIGGKVGVNLPAGKNLMGAFHHPLAVFSDPQALETLPSRAYRSGLAEVVKMGVIKRPAILSRLERLADEPFHPGPSGALLRGSEGIIRAAAREKAWYVSRDPEDRAERLHLNFGHTVGHALEAAYGYRTYTHGEAVAVGIAAALEMSVRRAGLPRRDADRVVDLLRSLGLPVRLRRAPPAGFWRALRRDKKRGRAPLRMVLSPAIGAAKTYELPSLTPLRDVVLSLVEKP